MEVTIKDSKLSIRATDNINYITVSADVKETSEFSMVVQSKQFQQIVAKLTTAETEISIEDNKVRIKANGTYTLALSTDADGSLITFPQPNVETTGTSHQITLAEINSILSYNKACKADMKEVPAYFNYYMDADGVLTTNTFKGCFNPVKVVDTPVSLAPNVVELISSVADDSGVCVSQTEDSVIFTSSIGTLVGRKCLPADVEAFPADGLKQALSAQQEHKVVLNRTQLYQALDRMCLFVDSLESNKLTVTFTSKDVVLYSDYTDSEEHVNYVTDDKTSHDFVDTVLTFDSTDLKSEVSACDKESITIGFNESGIQIINNGITMALTVLEDEV